MGVPFAPVQPHQVNLTVAFKLYLVELLEIYFVPPANPIL